MVSQARVKCCQRSIFRRWRTSSSAVKNRRLQIVLSLIVLVFGCALEELLPKFAGVGFPILLVAVQTVASRRPVAMSVLFALAAGAAEEAISGLPAMTAVSFTLAVAMLIRISALPRGAAALTYPLFQLWLYIWVPAMQGNVFSRILLALPIGLLTAFAVQAVLSWLEGKAAVDEQG